MAKILIIQPIAKEGIKMLEEKGFEIKQLEDHNIENIKKEVIDADAILVRTAEIPREVIKCGKKLKVIARHGVGVDNIDIEAATENGVYVTNAPIASEVSVAEHVLGLMISLAKNIRKADIALREGKFEVRNEYIGVELEGKTLGILGLGKIGRKVAIKAAKGFGMKIIGYDPFITQDNVDSVIEVTNSWEKVFKEADFISLNLPLNDKTRGIVGKKEFKMMKKTAYIINCARGPIVNEEELIQALNKGLIAGAGLDVFTEEPPAKDNPLFGLNNTIVTPHMAAHTHASMIKMATHAAQGIIEVLSNKPPAWPVNKV